MLTISEARALIAEQVRILAPERVPLAATRGRVLRESLVADEDIPAFDRSAMDGYAVNGEGTGPFGIVAEIPAGFVSERTIGPGECARIFTGSAIPSGTTRVVIQELAQRDGDSVSFTKRDAATNIRRRGEDSREGSVLIERGVRLGATELSLFAQLGKTNPLVSQRPRILHVATGSEIVPPDSVPQPGQIRDSNSALVAALAAESGAEIVSQYRTGDDFAALLSALQSPPTESWDVLLLSGGASVGDHDLGLSALHALGFTAHFQQLNLRPGKPLIFATRGRQIAFVIPGNPLSHVICWHVVIRAALDMLTIGDAEFGFATAPLGGTVPLRGHARETWWPARLSWESDAPIFLPLKWQSSGDLTGLVGFDALIRVPSGSPPLQPGEKVSARLIRSSIA
jgi:molybdopterin molybdotransferase